MITGKIYQVTYKSKEGTQTKRFIRIPYGYVPINVDENILVDLRDDIILESKEVGEINWMTKKESLK